MSHALRDEASIDDPEDIFEMIDIIGEGSYGLICTCRNVKQNKIFAIKFLEIEFEDDTNLQKEINILKEAVNCHHIVQYYGCYIKDSTLMIVMEYCEGGSCLEVLKHCKKEFSEDEIGAICADMVQGLQYLHSHKILHRDLKAGNVLLTKDGAKLADFGVSAQLNFTMQKKVTVVGSPYWMAPEVISVKNDSSHEGYDLKADIWSLGITAIELAEGQPPLFEIASLRVIFLIPARDPPTFKNPSKWGPDFLDFVRICLQKDPTKRPTANELMKHPFLIKGSKNSALIKNIVEFCVPILNEVRKRKRELKTKEDSEDKGGSQLSSGQLIGMNSQNGTARFLGSSSTYGTTLINGVEQLNTGTD